jgi:hypothetical protein
MGSWLVLPALFASRSLLPQLLRRASVESDGSRAGELGVDIPAALPTKSIAEVAELGVLREAERRWRGMSGLSIP